MSKKFAAEINDDVMKFQTEYSDRFVYSNCFVPMSITFEDLKTPVLPFYIKQKLLELKHYGMMDNDKLKKVLEELGYTELWSKNGIDELRNRLEEVPFPSGGGIVVRPPRKDLIEIRPLNEAIEQLKNLGPKLKETDREVLNSIAGKLSASKEVFEKIDVMEKAVPLKSETTRPSVLDDQDPEFIAGLLKSEVGYLLLDRTRIRPVGFALGEHVYSLSLAPDEQVTLEQKTFTKREVTFEEQSEEERQFDVELSSTYSTELQEGFERQKNRTDNWGLTWNAGASYQTPETFPYGTVNANFGITETRSVAEAHQNTMRQSVKDSQTASSKVSAKYRTQHKTTFRIVSEQGFESTSKRTIRNPNRTTPVTLHYFKVLQRLKMTQERYGVRLCWSPSVKDPALTFYEKIRKGRQFIIEEALKTLPPKPVEPSAPGPADTPTSTKRETKTFFSANVTADQWGLVGDMRADYEVDIPYDKDYSWDGNVNNVNINVSTMRDQKDVSRWIVGMPIPIQDEGGNKLRVTVHIGAKMWIGGPGIKFQVSAGFYKDVTITQQVGENTIYNEALADYRIRLEEWEDQRNDVLAKAHETADAFEKRMIETLNPVNEMVSQIIEQYFPPSVRDEIWEIDYWQRLFDWERASFVAYPSWWSNVETRNPTLDPANFLNASWAKLYLPIRVGMEQQALRWIYGKSHTRPLAKLVEARFKEVVNDLRKFRADVLGSADEAPELAVPCQETADPFSCLAVWNELMPTDGTHIEVIQGVSSAADMITTSEITDAAELRKAILESERLSSNLKTKAHEQMKNPTTVVHVGTDNTSSSENF